MKSILLTTIAAVLLVGCGGSIHKAALYGNIESVKQHLDAGTDVNAKDDIGRTPLHWSTVFGKNEIVELLIAEGADINAKNRGGVTPLYDAAFKGRKEIAELLIAEGADVNAKDVDGETPFDWYIHTEFADLLRKHGAKTGEELKAEGKYEK